IFDAQPWSTGPPWFYAVKLALDEPALGALVLIGLGGAAARFAASRQEETSQNSPGLSPLDRHLVVALLVALAIFSASETKKLLYLIVIIPTSALLMARMLTPLRTPIRAAVLVALALVALRTIPYYNPEGAFVRGVADQLPVAQAVQQATSPQDTVYMLDDYFSTIQYYAERRTESYWQRPTLVMQTQRIPYIRFGNNMHHVPPSELVATMVRTTPGVWVVRPHLWAQIKPALGQQAKVLFIPERCTPDAKEDTGACVVVRTGASSP
ncbi:MAG: hypothetical protein AAFS10_27145, partial [Myxococcota bacterium]